MQGHPPRKRFGQNFLADAHYVARIIDAIDPGLRDNVVEIGPGLGALTGALIERAGKISAIEIDRDLAARLRERFTADRLALHEADALAFDFAALGADLRVVGNLPYNISTPLLFHLASYDCLVRDIHVMLQREVVARMTAAPDTADYGRLSVMLQARFRVSRLFTVPAGAFRPAPNVESAVARLLPLGADRPAIADEALFSRIVAAAFGQRRKTLRNALAALCNESSLRASSIDPGARGETLSVADFVR
ncbi:MAG TPA: 16S rRNA (adenine(1518)-N(6)/adenine(1519)-N(6))-dimethyltransferase RsmA, partial [Casimicrobiaceae bacterium]|nr:16S rRNA (adenine(1518)-N(6)/adenine(1519)-N(6))-dimethyltransferase RsmA [Casimicrobiaceae bacterium]